MLYGPAGGLYTEIEFAYGRDGVRGSRSPFRQQCRAAMLEKTKIDQTNISSPPPCAFDSLPHDLRFE
jgi:hypothetical protein